MACAGWRRRTTPLTVAQIFSPVLCASLVPQLHGGSEVCVEYGDFTTQFFGRGGIRGGGLVVAIGSSATKAGPPPIGLGLGEK